jgi:hypothetical protein
MNIDIPDKLYKLFALIGILLIGYSFYHTEIVEQNYFSEIDRNRALKDSLFLNKMRLDHLSEKIVDISHNLSKKYQVENPIKKSDSSITFNRVLSGPSERINVSDSINKLWMEYKSQNFKNTLLEQKIEFSDKYLDEEENLKKTSIELYQSIYELGSILLLAGIVLWFIDNGTPFPSTKTKQHERVYQFCQSCGKRFNSMLKYGTNKDKSLNYGFCHKCYKKGKFTSPNLTKEEFLKQQKALIKEKSWITRKILMLRFINLERWDNDY